MPEAAVAMPQDMLNRYFVTALLLLALSSGVFATTDSRAVATTGNTIAFSEEIIIGKVVKIDKANFLSTNDCLYYIYDLQVERSLKGDLEQGDVIKVGVTTALPTFGLGDFQLAVLINFVEENLKFCNLESAYAELIPEIRQTSTGVVGIVKINKFNESKVNNDTTYTAIKCGEYSSFLFEENGDLSIEAIDSISGFRNCKKVEGSFIELEEEILDLLE